MVGARVIAGYLVTLAASCPAPATVQPSLVRIKERVEARGSIAPSVTTPHPALSPEGRGRT